MSCIENERSTKLLTISFLMSTTKKNQQQQTLYILFCEKCRCHILQVGLIKTKALKSIILPMTTSEFPGFQEYVFSENLKHRNTQRKPHNSSLFRSRSSARHIFLICSARPCTSWLLLFSDQNE